MPELVRALLEHQPPFEAPGRYIVFKRWDKLDAADDPAVVVFFAPPDVLSGLFTLANFDETRSQAVVAPFSSGCASIVYHPYHELQSQTPKAVLGMFDVSARPCVPSEVLTFAVPVLMVAIYMPLQFGEKWVDGAWSLVTCIVIPLILVGIVIPQSFAGERERHTLETLLASRLPDRAIPWGKVLLAVAYGWGMTIPCSLWP